MVVFLTAWRRGRPPSGIQPRRRPPAEPPGLAPGRAGQRRVHDQPRAAGRVPEVAGRHVHEQLRPLATATCRYIDGGGRAGQDPWPVPKIASFGRVTAKVAPQRRHPTHSLESAHTKHDDVTCHLRDTLTSNLPAKSQSSYRDNTEKAKTRQFNRD